MSLTNFLLYFLTGGIVTTAIVGLEQTNHRLLSGLATLIPVFTLVAYVFIGQTQNGVAVSQHAKFVLVGTIASWVPYMLVVIWLAPRLGPSRAILAGLVTFFALAIPYVLVVARWKLFQ
jgi:uncharacterized membrane protein (GlpM family)